MLVKIESIFEVILFSEADPEIPAIYKDLEGVSYEEHASEGSRRDEGTDGRNV